MCLEQKFVVFGSQLDLQAHMVDAHGEEMTNRDKKGARRIEVPFAAAENNRGGGAGRGRGFAGGTSGRDAPPDPPPPPRILPSSGQSAPFTTVSGVRRAGFGGRLTNGDGTPSEPPSRDEPTPASSTVDPRVLE